ncbi:MAG: exodeoxyribonuclease large subunit [Chloroflexi bacterium]|jgi:exodeoxyribonuclease VII large subunit|nr:exodeoxyribonuclease large subunit [Chloroflexota bacterium]
MEIYSVTEALYYLKIKLDCDEHLSDLWMQGEVSGCSRTASGHYFFSLKDGTGQMSCVLFKPAAMRQAHLPRDGSNYIMHGRMDVYETNGRLQFYVDQIQPDGVGRLHLEFEALKQRLEAEGLFAVERKRPLPVRPRTIGIVTSPTAAAFQDILNVLGRRYPLAHLILSPTQVQGEAAPPQIVRALAALNQLAEVEVIIVARGGGSLEDLWAFNDERVARAIFASRIPVVTGVGHEVDYTIVDFVSDLRAPTPSAAAELVAPHLDELRDEVHSLADRVYIALQNKLDEERSGLESINRRLILSSPAARIAAIRRRMEELKERNSMHLNHSLELRQARVSSLASRLKVLNPNQILERGYAIVSREADGRVITDAGEIIAGETLQVRVKNGTFGVKTV